MSIVELLMYNVNLTSDLRPQCAHMDVCAMGVPKWILLSIALLILGGFAVQVTWLQQSEVQRQQPTTNRTKPRKLTTYPKCNHRI